VGNNILIEGRGSGPLTSSNTIDITHFIYTSHVAEYGRALYEALFMNKLIIVSDGSAKDGDGASAWILTTDELFTSAQYILGQLKVPECKCDSYRAECFGIYGGLWSLIQLLHQFGGTRDFRGSAIEVGCDNMSAISRCLDTRTYPAVRSSDSDFDIITGIRALIPDGLTIKWRHVKGHQTGDDLDVWGQLNNLADKLAGEHRMNLQAAMPPSATPIPGEKWQLTIRDNKIHKNIQSSVYQEMSRHNILPYWIKKERFSEDGADKVNWEAIGAAMQQSTPQQRRWITKRAARECGANSVLFKRKTRDNDFCPLCQQPESALHVLQCQDIRAQRQWTLSVQEFGSWLETQQTDPNIVAQLCHGLLQWQKHDQILPRSANDDLIRQQNVLGWNGVSEGCFHICWEHAQQNYFTNQNSRRSGRKWQAQVCRRIWMIPWSMWAQRNSIEHANDQKAESEALDMAIRAEVDTGYGNCEELAQLFLAIQPLDDISRRSVAYKKSWLRGVLAWRGRIERRELMDTTLQGMRRTMRRFLRQAGGN
jgi:hypothetical protein